MEQAGHQTAKVCITTGCPASARSWIVVSVPVTASVTGMDVQGRTVSAGWPLPVTGTVVPLAGSEEGVVVHPPERVNARERRSRRMRYRQICIRIHFSAGWYSFFDVTSCRVERIRRIFSF
jgi:hypothetical protein